MDFEVCNRYLRYKGSLEASIGFDMLTGTTGSQTSLDGNQFHKFLQNEGFNLMARNPPMAQVKLLAGCLDWLLDFGALEFH